MCFVWNTYYLLVRCTNSLLHDILMYLTPALLFTVLDIGNSGELTFECTVAGYVEELTISEDLIDWTFNGNHSPLTLTTSFLWVVESVLPMAYVVLVF